MFNELSVSQVNSVDAVCEVMETFVRTYVVGKDAGLNELRFHDKVIKNIFQFNLHTEYSLDYWLKDNRIKKDLRDQFLEIVTTTPLVKESDVNHADAYSRSEFHIEMEGGKCQVWGLGAAWEFDTISISLATHDYWKKSVVQISHYCLNEQAEEKHYIRKVRHFSNEDTFVEHVKWCQHRQRENLKKSADLWESREQLFPHLFFISAIEKQIATLGNSRDLTKIVEALQKLDSYICNWKSGGFSCEDAVKITGLRMSPESDSTLKNFQVKGHSGQIF
ncbi:hypothetical protein ADIARSV_3833 [Arcticibacter svalbardensis MN12-7]|uniref:Uncharacterized protein n=1 Tax=Arcticibacter svalbardensis MN12-7 TaxID=1150600 RepID=R9GMS8_9SPHI|nr:hypothetical protein [Arcticibacter svalbardensis]EOR93033.1 hypothetical protein ADIARSV_3833 [Arcticibacter svalbardensis MN12-7]